MWVKLGSRMHRSFVPYRPDFCVKAETSTLEEAERWLARDPRVESTWRAKQSLWLRGPPEPVLRVRPKRLSSLHAVATDLRRATRTKGLLFFDVDHDPACRWAHERGLFFLCRLRVLPSGPVLAIAPDEDRWTFGYPDLRLSTARLCVQAATTGPAPRFEDPLVSVTFGSQTLSCRAPGDPRAERETLLALDRRIREEDPDVILTRGGDAWDVPFLLHRIRALGLEDRVRLGRDPDPSPDRPDQREKSIQTYGRWRFRTNAYYLRGRWHIDLSKKTLDGHDEREDLHGIVYLSRVSNRRPQDASRNGAGYGLQQMQIDLATDWGVALPWKRNLAEDWKDAATLCAVDRGGQIMVPEAGVYDDVVACDFSGYYPSLVVRHNLSSDTIGCDCCPEGPLIPELGRRVCTKRYGHQAEILRRLWPHRRYVKAILRKEASGLPVDLALLAKARAVKSEHKALGVVCFGYFRYRHARFGCAEVHQAIQCLSRAGMTRAREIAQAEGFAMVHALTDCVFLHKPGVTRAQALRLVRRVTDDVGVPMDVEGVYRWLVLLPSKTHSTASEVGVPNRYYGKFEDGSLKVRGIEVQRHSTPRWVRDAQQAMLGTFAQADHAEDFLACIPHALVPVRRAADALRRREVSARDLGVCTQARMDVDDYATRTVSRAALSRLRDAGLARRPGEYVTYVLLRSQGAHGGRAVPTEFVSDGTRDYDVPSYLRLLARSVETLLSPFGYTEDSVFRWLSGSAAGPLVASQARLPDVTPPRWIRRRGSA